MTAKTYDVAIIGAGIVGGATAMTLARDFDLSLVVLEAEKEPAKHQTGNNSGVIHSGLYYKPGSLKAKNCVEGRTELLEFCERENIAHDICGKVVVATQTEQIPALDELERRGKANGLEGMKRLTPEGIREHEPHVNGVDGLFVPQTGIVDYIGVTRAYARIMQEHGGELRLNAAVAGCHQDGDAMVLHTADGEIRAKNIINCAGLQSDRVARLCGVDPGLQIVPFRGEYYEIKPERHDLVKNLIYPVPDPRFPFLGVHYTRMIHGGVEAGPNAVLALKREGYTKWSICPKDMAQYLTYGGFWKMASKYWRMGFEEMYRSFSKSAFTRELQKIIPDITEADLAPGGAGVRAQALLPDGSLADDFRIVEKERMIHVLNAPSPAATASLAIGRSITEMAATRFELKRKA